MPVVKVQLKNETDGPARQVKSNLKGLGDAAHDANQRMAGLGQGLRQVGAAAASSLPGMGSMAGMLIGGGGIALGAAAAASALNGLSQEYRQFARAMSEISTLYKGSGADMQTLTAGIRAVSHEFNASKMDNAKAMYQIISAGTTDAARATDLLRVANELALGGVSDVATAADGLTTILNAWGASAGSAAQVADDLTTAVQLGKVKIGELTGEIATVAPAAAAMGVSFQEVLAAVDALSGSGTKVNVAMTGLRQVFANVLKPTSEAAEEVARLNASGLKLEFTGRRLKEVGFGQFLKELQDATKGAGQAESLSKMFGSVEGLIPLLSLATVRSDAFNASLREMAENGGSSAQAAEKMKAGIDFQIGAAEKDWETFTSNLGEWWTINVLGAIGGTARALKESTDSGWTGLENNVTPQGRAFEAARTRGQEIPLDRITRTEERPFEAAGRLQWLIDNEFTGIFTDAAQREVERMRQEGERRMDELRQSIYGSADATPRYPMQSPGVTSTASSFNMDTILGRAAAVTAMPAPVTATVTAAALPPMQAAVETPEQASKREQQAAEAERLAARRVAAERREAEQRTEIYMQGVAFRQANNEQINAELIANYTARQEMEQQFQTSTLAIADETTQQAIAEAQRRGDDLLALDLQHAQDELDITRRFALAREEAAASGDQLRVDAVERAVTVENKLADTRTAGAKAAMEAAKAQQLMSEAIRSLVSQAADMAGDYGGAVQAGGNILSQAMQPGGITMMSAVNVAGQEVGFLLETFGIHLGGVDDELMRFAEQSQRATEKMRAATASAASIAGGSGFGSSATVEQAKFDLTAPIRALFEQLRASSDMAAAREEWGTSAEAMIQIGALRATILSFINGTPNARGALASAGFSGSGDIARWELALEDLFGTTDWNVIAAGAFDAVDAFGELGDSLDGVTAAAKMAAAATFEGQTIVEQGRLQQSFQAAGGDVFQQRRAYDEYLTAIESIRAGAELAARRAGTGAAAAARTVAPVETPPVVPVEPLPVVTPEEIAPVDVLGGAAYRLVPGAIATWDEIFTLPVEPMLVPWADVLSVTQATAADFDVQEWSDVVLLPAMPKHSRLWSELLTVARANASEFGATGWSDVVLLSPSSGSLAKHSRKWSEVVAIAQSNLTDFGVSSWSGITLLATSAGAPTKHERRWSDAISMGTASLTDFSVSGWSGIVLLATAAGEPPKHERKWSDAVTISRATLTDFSASGWSDMVWLLGSAGEPTKHQRKWSDVISIGQATLSDYGAPEWSKIVLLSTSAGEPAKHARKWSDVVSITQATLTDFSVSSWSGMVLLSTTSGAPAKHERKWSEAVAMSQATLTDYGVSAWSGIVLLTTSGGAPAKHARTWAEVVSISTANLTNFGAHQWSNVVLLETDSGAPAKHVRKFSDVLTLNRATLTDYGATQWSSVVYLETSSGAPAKHSRPYSDVLTLTRATLTQFGATDWSSIVDLSTTATKVSKSWSDLVTVTGAVALGTPTLTITKANVPVTDLVNVSWPTGSSMFKIDFALAYNTASASVINIVPMSVPLSKIITLKLDDTDFINAFAAAMNRVTGGRTGGV